MKCKKCGREAIVKLRHYNLALCREHFIEFIEGRVEKAIKKFRMFKKSDKVLVAVSGGKDSVSLWHILVKLGYEVDGLFIRTGKEGLIKIAERIVEENAKILERRLIKIDATEYFEGLSTGEIAKILRRPVCSICGTIRRYLMNKVAYEGGYDVVVTGHNLSDEATVLFGNILNWQIGYISRQWPYLPKTHEKFVPKAKPLVLNYEEDIRLYARVTGIKFLDTACPFSLDATTTVYKSYLTDMEKKQPGITIRFFTGFLRNKNKAFVVEEEDLKLKECKVCGYPTTEEVCSFCRLRGKVAKVVSKT